MTTPTLLGVAPFETHAGKNCIPDIVNPEMGRRSFLHWALTKSFRRGGRRAMAAAWQVFTWHSHAETFNLETLATYSKSKSI